MRTPSSHRVIPVLTCTATVLGAVLAASGASAAPTPGTTGTAEVDWATETYVDVNTATEIVYQLGDPTNPGPDGASGPLPAGLYCVISANAQPYWANFYYVFQAYHFTGTDNAPIPWEMQWQDDQAEAFALLTRLDLRDYARKPRPERAVTFDACLAGEVVDETPLLRRARYVAEPTPARQFQMPWGPMFDRVPWGTPGDEIFVADWDGDGQDSIAYREGNLFTMFVGLRTGEAASRSAYGRPGDLVYTGDWDGDGDETFAVRRGNTFHLKNDFTGGAADIETAYGRPDDEVIVGDWDGDGVATPSVRRGNTLYLKNDFTGGEADEVTAYGTPDDEVIVGDWDGDGLDTPSVRRAHVFYLKNDLTGGVAESVLVLGTMRDWAYTVRSDAGGVQDTVLTYRELL